MRVPQALPALLSDLEKYLHAPNGLPPLSLPQSNIPASLPSADGAGDRRRAGCLHSPGHGTIEDRSLSEGLLARSAPAAPRAATAQ
jgi:hypothetical protein